MGRSANAHFARNSVRVAQGTRSSHAALAIKESTNPLYLENGLQIMGGCGERGAVFGLLASKDQSQHLEVAEEGGAPSVYTTTAINNTKP